MKFTFKMKRTIKDYFLNPKRTFLGLEYYMLTSLVDYLSDEVYLRLLFRNRMGYSLDLHNPCTYSEKIQWLKLESKKHPEYTEMVDKATAKEYVASIIGDKYIIPTYGIWESVEEIDWNILPNQFVVKSTGDSGGIVVCKDKSHLDISKAIIKLKNAGSRDYTKYNKEYPYKNVPHRYIAEKYMEDESGYELKDYKIFCFDGEPKFLFVATDRQKEGEDVKFDFFDLDWNHIPVKNGHKNSMNIIKKPTNFEEMLDVSRKLSAGLPHVRVDLYNCNGKIYFGELTFFHFSGLTPFEPQEWDFKFGEYLKLPIEQKKKKL